MGLDPVTGAFLVGGSLLGGLGGLFGGDDQGSVETIKPSFLDQLIRGIQGGEILTDQILDWLRGGPEQPPLGIGQTDPRIAGVVNQTLGTGVGATAENKSYNRQGWRAEGFESKDAYYDKIKSDWASEGFNPSSQAPKGIAPDKWFTQQDNEFKTFVAEKYGGTVAQSNKNPTDISQTGRVEFAEGGQIGTPGTYQPGRFDALFGALGLDLASGGFDFNPQFREIPEVGEIREPALSPEQTAEYFDRAVGAPARNALETYVLPGIKADFARQGALTGSFASQAQGRARNDLQIALDSELAKGQLFNQRFMEELGVKRDIGVEELGLQRSGLISEQDRNMNFFGLESLNQGAQLRGQGLGILNALEEAPIGRAQNKLGLLGGLQQRTDLEANASLVQFLQSRGVDAQLQQDITSFLGQQPNTSFFQPPGTGLADALQVGGNALTNTALAFQLFGQGSGGGATSGRTVSDAFANWSLGQ